MQYFERNCFLSKLYTDGFRKPSGAAFVFPDLTASYVQISGFTCELMALYPI